jgi:hypothetical protein
MSITHFLKKPMVNAYIIENIEKIFFLGSRNINALKGWGTDPHPFKALMCILCSGLLKGSIGTLCT